MRILRWASRVWIGILILSTLLSALLAGGRLALPLFAPSPALRASEPADGAGDVSVLADLLVQFDRPMNPRTVERAVRLIPPTAYTTTWDATGTTLTISPTVLLLPATDYRLMIEQSGLSRELSRLVRPITISFRTVAAPAVLATVPAEGSVDVPSSGALLVSFSRAMVPREALLQPITMPELHFEPPISGQAIWIDQMTLLFRPDGVLLPGEHYQALVDANLTDLGGGPLGQRVAWSFQTAVPLVLEYGPLDGTRDVPSRKPLTAHLSVPLPRERIIAGLTISPTLATAIISADLPDGTQVLTITPQIGWNPSTAYHAELRLGERPVAHWSFVVAPRPALIGRFPGVGQILPPGQDIRLIFSTRVGAEALREAIRFDPPATDVRVSGSGEEVRIGAQLRAGTAYTLTIPAEFADQSGAQLGTNYPVRFTTAAAQPALLLPEAVNRQVTVAPDQPIDLLVRRTNVSALLVDLYELDEATVVRTLVFDATDWRFFEPERYRRPLLRSWTVPLSDTINATAEDRLVVKTSDGQALPPGIYYVRIRTPEGPRTDLLLTVSRTRLALQFGGSGGLVWATDAISGTIIANESVALYQDDALILEGTTNQQGLLAFTIAGGGPHRYAALVRGLQPALVTDGPLTFVQPGLGDRYRLSFTTDAALYSTGRVGAAIQVAGFVRQVVTGTLGLPINPPPVTIQLYGVDGRIITELRSAVDQYGTFAAQIPLDAALPVGSYRVQAEIGGRVESVPLLLAPQHGSGLDLRVYLPDPARTDEPAMLMVETPTGLPVGGLPITWTLSAEPVVAILPDGYIVGTGTFAPPTPQVGTGRTDAQGRLTVVISETASLTGMPLRYHLTARAVGPDDMQAIGAASFVVHPADVYVGIRLRQQVVAAGASADIELLAVDPAGIPQPGKTLRVELFRADGLNERPVATRQVVAGGDGTALLSLPLSGGQQYLIRASTAASQGRRAISETMAWAIGTPTTALDGPLLIADRSVYKPGDTATLLVRLADARPTALITIARGTELVPEVRAIRSGETITVTLLASDTPGVRVTLFVPGVQQRPASTTLSMLRVAASASQPVVAISTDQPAYMPGSTATVTVTTTDAGGQPLPANLLVALVGGERPIVGASNTQQADPPNPLGRAVYWSEPLRTETGIQRLVIPLPHDPGPLRLEVWAAGTDQAVSAELDLQLQEDLRVRVDAPPFLRVGDQFDIGTWLVNTTALTETVSLNLTVDGIVAADGGFPEQTAILAPYERKRFAWIGIAAQGPMVRMRVLAQSARGTASDSVERPVVQDVPIVTVTGGGLLAAADQRIITGDGSGGLTIDLAAAPDAIALRVARTMAVQPARSLVDEAALLLLTAPMTETHNLARAAIARLTAAQASNGGWGWWPTLPAQPVVTAVVLEAYAAARRAGLNVPDRSRSQGFAWSIAAVDDPQLALDVRVQLAYALSLHGQMPIERLQALAAEADILGPEGAATLLLALPPSAAQNRADVLARLNALAIRDTNGVHWAARADTLGGATAITGLALLALQQANIEPQLRTAALANIAATRGPDGWGSPYATARAIIALRAIWLGTALPPRIAIELNGERLVEQSSGLMTATLRLDLPSTRLRSTNLLTTTIIGGVGGSALLSYRLSGVVTTPVSLDGTLLLRDELEGGIVRLTLLVRQPIPFALLDVPLPPGADVQVRPNSGPMVLVAHTPERLLFATDRLVPGLYEFRYQLQGNEQQVFRVPQPQLRQMSGEHALEER